MFSNDVIGLAGEVSEFMVTLYNVDKERYITATEHILPFGDIAYAEALIHWRKNGKPKQAIFSWEDTQTECPLTIAFRKEISEKFGLPILNKEEAKKHRKKWQNSCLFVIEKEVKDWGLN